MAPTSDQPLSVSAAQLTAGTNVTKNLDRMGELARDAASRGAEVVVFPEAAMYAWDGDAEELAAAAREHGQTFVEGLREVACAAGVTLVAGMFADAGSARPYNRLVVVDADGVRDGYDKVHLYDAFSARESDKVAAGPTCADMSELCTFEVGPFTFGLLNCYDLRFPEMARALVDRGADVLVVSSAWVAGPYKEMHWETLLRARAIENTCYVVASSQPPPASAGLSMVIDPFGLVAATCVDTEGLAVHRLDPAHLRQVRVTLPCLHHRRYPIHARSC